jgi:hypothetical protein
MDNSLATNASNILYEEVEDGTIQERLGLVDGLCLQGNTDKKIRGDEEQEVSPKDL